jgi:hypothetical protein
MLLEDSIIDNPINKRNLQDLLVSFDRDLFIPFIGAGPSIILGEPDWNDLFLKLCKALNAKNIKRKKHPDGSVDYPVSFSRLFYGSQDQSKFYSELFKIIEPTKTSATFFHKRLVQAFGSYITTNYDSPIEEAFVDTYPDRKLIKHYFSCYGLNNIDGCIVYLHGHKDINFCVIKSEDYNYFYPSIGDKSGGIPIVEDFLTEVFTRRSIIFVGFSFNDKYIEKLLRYIHARETLRFPHYWLLSESLKSYESIKQKSDKLKSSGDIKQAEYVLSQFYSGQMNIKPIVYKEDYHIFAEKLFQKLGELKPVDTTPGVISGIPRE